jgi:hypothetical protein
MRELPQARKPMNTVYVVRPSIEEFIWSSYHLKVLCMGKLSVNTFTIDNMRKLML